MIPVAKLTEVEYYEKAGNDIGLCLNCKAWVPGVQPHKKCLPCPSCGQNRVIGMEEGLKGLAITIVDYVPKG